MAPTCTITYPKQEEIIIKGTTVRVSVDAEDSDGKINYLHYLINDVSMNCGSSNSLYYLWNTTCEDTGSYTIKVQAEDNEGSMNSDKINIHLVSGDNNEIPQAEFTVSGTHFTPGEEVMFADASNNHPASWLWSFGDGSTATAQNPSHTYSALGIYTVSLTVSNEYGTDKVSKPDLIHVTTAGTETGTVTDYDGNVYNTVKIGDQWWMAENLRVTHYAWGLDIPIIENNDEWSDLEVDDKAMCFIDNTASLGETYGALYSWAAAVNRSEGSFANPSRVQGVCPSGWHIPSDAEWKQLEIHLGMLPGVANEIGHRGTTEGSKLAGMAELWNPGELTENLYFGSTGFNGVPAGGRNDLGYYLYQGSHAAMWSCTPFDEVSVWSRCLYNDYTEIRRYNCEKVFGFAVRCVKD